MQSKITTPKLTTIRAHWKWVLLPALPLIVVLAMVMFVAWGQSRDQAEAAGPAPGMALTAPTIVEVGSTFTVIISGNPVPLKGSPGFGGFAAQVEVSAGLKYNGSGDCLSELKATVQGGAAVDICLSLTTMAGNHIIAVVSGDTLPLPEMDASGPNEDLVNFSYQCNTPGTKTITLLTAAQATNGAAYTAPDANPIFVKTKVGANADQITIDCVVPGMALTAPTIVEVGSKFTVTISGNPVPAKGSPGFGGFAAEVEVSAGLKYNGIDDCPSELKATVQGGAAPEVCLSFTSVAGNHAIAVLTANTLPLPEMDASGPNEDLASFSYQCNTPGTKTITLLAAPNQSPNGAQYTAPDASNIFVKTKVGDNADQITIYCVPPVGMALTAPETVEVGTTFTVTISGNSVPPKGSPGFGGFLAEVEVSAGLKYNGIDDCPSELKATVQGGGPLLSCVSGITGEGTHVILVISHGEYPLLFAEMDASGPNEDLANFSYRCNTPGTQTITLLTRAQSNGNGSFYFTPDGDAINAKAKVGDNADQITIDCGDVGGIAELPEVAGTPLEAAGSSGSNTGLIAGIVAAIAAGSATLTGGAWYARRRWA
ncbi:MAG: hypothetical protein IIC88_05615 [Chloroflexi bacterium]|nr:hypothetical protein [Chloroflexota bacterium]